VDLSLDLPSRGMGRNVSMWRVRGGVCNKGILESSHGKVLFS
jgi:hypothetical protein